MASENLQPKGSCRITEIVQYTCGVENSLEKPEIRCFPIPRIFRICSGRPAVEITKLTDIDMTTGEVEIPPGSCDVPVIGKSWREIHRYGRSTVDNGTDKHHQEQIEMSHPAYSTPE